MDKQQLVDEAKRLAEEARTMAEKAADLAERAAAMGNDATMQAAAQAGAAGDGSVPFLFLFTAFVLACVVGYYVVWSVTPALHSPLMSVTNAISSVIIVGALIAAGPADFNLAKVFGFIAVILASINIFGGFLVTRRMLSMFKRKQR